MGSWMSGITDSTLGGNKRRPCSLFVVSRMEASLGVKLRTRALTLKVHVPKLFIATLAVLWGRSIYLGTWTLRVR